MSEMRTPSATVSEPWSETERRPLRLRSILYGCWQIYRSHFLLLVATLLPVQVSCPRYVTVAAIQNLPLQNAFPAYRTGVGIAATIVRRDWPPFDFTGAQVTESVSQTQISCPANFGNQCSGNDTFTVGQPAAPGRLYGSAYPAMGLDQFRDFHTTVSSTYNMLGGTGINQCNVVGSQTYSACGQIISNFTITRQFDLGSINGTGVTFVGVSNQ